MERHSIMVGEHFGGYRVLRKLGEGGMGEVFLAEHDRVFRRAAIKVLRPDLSSNAEAVQRLFAEARATSLIRHPAIVEVLDCDTHESGRAYLIMERLEGETLAVFKARPGLAADLPAVLALVGRAATGLGAAHAAGVVHRDVKPENLFVVFGPDDAPSAVKWLDFGVAKLTHGLHAGKKTHTGLFMGTPAYASPEQCRGSGHVDHRTDVYALGCVLFELVAGRPPFVSDSPGELIAHHLMTAPPRLSQFVPDLPAGLDLLVDGMLAKDPASRPAAMDDVVSAIERIVGAPASAFDRILRGAMPFVRAREAWLLPPADAAASDGTAALLGLLGQADRAGRATVSTPTDPTPVSTASPTGEIAGTKKLRAWVAGALVGASLCAAAVFWVRAAKPPAALPPPSAASEPQAPRAAPAPPAVARASALAGPAPSDVNIRPAARPRVRRPAPPRPKSDFVLVGD